MVCPKHTLTTGFETVAVMNPGQFTPSDDANIAGNSAQAEERIEKMLTADAGSLSPSIAVEHKNASRPTGNDSAAIDWEYLKISRDARHGGAWDRIEAINCVEEIPVQVEITDFYEGVVTLGVASVQEDVPLEEGGFLFREGDVIVLTAEEMGRVEQAYLQSANDRWQE